MAQSYLSWSLVVITFKIRNPHFGIGTGPKYRIDSEGVFR